MKKTLIGCALLLAMCAKSPTDNLVQVQPVSNLYLKKVFPTEDYSRDRDLFLIRLGNDTSEFGVLTPIHMLKDNHSRMIAIKNLLQLRGDTRLCGVPMRGYNFSKGSVYEFKVRRYSIQVEALFFINMIYFGNDFPFYSDTPCLSSLEDDRQQTVDGDLIDEAFDCYERWFQKVEKMDWNKATETKLDPLEGCQVRWCD